MKPDFSKLIKNKKPVELCPDPKDCFERGCEEPIVIAFILKDEKQFKFACQAHSLITDTSPIYDFDTIENYNKKRKRRMYHNQLKGVI